MESFEEEGDWLDINLCRKSRRHNLTSRNVRAILREVITNEDVVAMMKMAIRDTQDLPLFEPKMTRSRLKTVQQGRLSNSSPSATTAFKFVDIDLEEDEESSDEDYCPDEDEEDPAEEQIDEHQLDNQGCTSSEKSSFLEKLNAVETELDCSMCFDQPRDRHSDDKEYEGKDGCLALRTRSRLHLEDVPLGQLEAELVSDDTTDVCDGTFDQEDDPQWTLWLQSLLVPDCQDELDEEDDPEYNFVDDLTEPDMEDYRTDRAVQITKREVNELLEELFNTLHEEEEEAEEVHENEEEEEESERPPKCNTPQVFQLEMPLANILTEQQRIVGKQNQSGHQRRALQDTTNHRTILTNTTIHYFSPASSFHLDHNQKLQLQQQIQQHVQLLTEVHLLTRDIPALSQQANISKHLLDDLHQRASTQDEELCVSSSFRVCNLKGALDLLLEVDGHHGTAAATENHRLLPTMSASVNSLAFPLLPAHTAWLFATRPEFLYPELLPVCSLNPEHHHRPHKSVFTAGEEGLSALGLKHFKGAIQSDDLICSFLLCKSVSAFRKHVQERIGSEAQPDNIIKSFVMEEVAPPLPLACSRVMPCDQRPPVDRNSSKMPNWLQNSQHIIRRTRSSSPHYPSQLPPGCSLRLHPFWLRKTVRYKPRPHSRIFPLAHNNCLLPLAKAPSDYQPISIAPPLICPTVPLATLSAETSPITCGDIRLPSFPIDSNVLPHNLTNLVMPCSVAPPAYLLLQVTVPPLTSPSSTLRRVDRPSEGGGGGTREKEARDGGKGEDGASERGCEGGASEGGGGEGGTSEGNSGEGGASEGGGREGGGEGEASEGGGGEGGETEGRGGDGGASEGGGGDGEEEDEEEEEDFDELTQDEDEEEELSSEESVLSVPELQDTMKQLTWLAAERPLCEDGDSEDDQSLMSQEEEEEEDEDEDEDDTQKDSAEGRNAKDQIPSGETMSTTGTSCAGRGRGRRRPLRGLSRTRQQRPMEDTSKLLLLLDDDIVEKDPLRESKDAAFAQSYLSRVREALQDIPGQMEEFVSVLNEFEDLEDEDRVVLLFRKLRCILSNRSDLLRDFAAFLLPEQALQCGLWEEQQAFERSRRFLRQLEISFVDNPSHYQKIIKALQTKTDLTPHSITELKAQMETLLKGHAHLQSEFWVFFDELRPIPAHFGQFEEADWPEGGEGGARGSFEEVTSPEEDESALKHQPIANRHQRKMEAKFKGCDWSSKSWPRLSSDVKLHSHRRKGCLRCHGNQSTGHTHQEVELMSEWAESELSGQMRSGDEGDEEEENPVLKRRREESELPVPALNVSLTASGEKKILWNREADRVILTRCQQDGAIPSTFEAVAEQLGNKTPIEVSGRFEELMKLFRTAHTEALPADPDQPEEVFHSSQT